NDFRAGNDQSTGRRRPYAAQLGRADRKSLAYGGEIQTDQRAGPQSGNLRTAGGLRRRRRGRGIPDRERQAFDGGARRLRYFDGTGYGPAFFRGGLAHPPA